MRSVSYSRLSNRLPACRGISINTEHNVRVNRPHDGLHKIQPSARHHVRVHVASSPVTIVAPCRRNQRCLPAVLSSADPPSPHVPASFAGRWLEAKGDAALQRMREALASSFSWCMFEVLASNDSRIVTSLDAPCVSIDRLSLLAPCLPAVRYTPTRKCTILPVISAIPRRFLTVGAKKLLARG